MLTHMCLCVRLHADNQESVVAEDVIYLLLKQRNFCIFPFSFALKNHSQKT